MFSILFYIFSLVIIVSAITVITSRNTVHSVLFLILAFFNSAALFIMLEAEFLAMVLVVVYVGAVAILFLFVVMMLDLDSAVMRQGFLNYLPLGLVIAAILLCEIILLMIFTSSPLVFADGGFSNLENIDGLALSNTAVIGNLLYTEYLIIFEIAGMILLVAMIGAVMLTLKHKHFVKRQDVSQQTEPISSGRISLVSIQPKKK